MHADHRPSDTTCPTWCNRSHDHADGGPVAHRTDPWTVAVVERRTEADDTPFDRLAATDLAVGAESRFGDTWIWITPEDDVRRGLILSRESAQRLVRTLTTIFDEVSM